jgi:hypothetical protein
LKLSDLVAKEGCFFVAFLLDRFIEPLLKTLELQRRDGFPLGASRYLPHVTILFVDAFKIVGEELLKCVVTAGAAKATDFEERLFGHPATWAGIIFFWEFPRIRHHIFYVETFSQFFEEPLMGRVVRG